MNRGQAYTLEGIIGAIVIASALVIGLQAVDPAPWTEPEPTNPEELRTQAQDLLDAAEDSGMLHKGVRCVDDNGNLDREGFLEGTGFENLTDNALGTGNFRMTIEYLDDGERVEETVVPGRPGRTSATATRLVTIYDTDSVLRHENDDCEQPFGVPPTVGDTDNFYIEDQHEDEHLHAVVKIRLVVW